MKDDFTSIERCTFGAPGYFKGYDPGYSVRAIHNKNTFTWAVLKAHSKNKAGTVTLRSADPRDVPEIDFKYFERGGEDDAEAVADGGRREGWGPRKTALRV